MRKILFFALMSALTFVFNANAQNSSPYCVTAAPVYNGINTYPSTFNMPQAEVGPFYGCLASQPNPAWFFFKVDSAGSVIIDISQINNIGTGADVDFICWGPFSSPSSPCTAQLDSNSVIDCSFSVAATETSTIPAALAGEYYLLMITNFSNQPGTITFSINSSGTGTISSSTSCETHAFYNTPLCIGGTLQLLSTNHLGLGSYSWSGPGGFTDSVQNPTLAGVGLANNGYYYVNYLRDSTCNVTDSVLVQADTCGTLSGTVYSDVNLNCNPDSGENGIGNVKIKLSQGATAIAYAWTDNFGFYYFNVPPGTYTVEVVADAAYPVTCPNSLAHTSTVTGLTISTENFAVDCSALDFVAATVSVGGIAFFPGQVHYLSPVVFYQGPLCNSGAIPGQVSLILDPLISYVSPYGSASAPDTVIISPAGDTLVWNVPDVTALNNYSYFSPFFYLTSSSATIGDSVRITVIVSTPYHDVDSTNNVYVRDFEVGNSYDPNIKEVIPAGIGSNGFIPATTPELEYTIHFQNTGTAPAHNIYILDTLSANLDISSLKIISSSHLQSTSLLAGNVLKFNFSNIMLPDSTSNEPGSHGFVQFKIAPVQGLNPGDQIMNEAYIYFDFNPPILTNTALNTIEFTTGVNETANNNFTVFPNPVTNLLNVELESASATTLSIKILDVKGKLVYEENVTIAAGKVHRKVDMSSFAKGVYVLQISSDKEVMRKKLVKQ